MGFIVHVEVSCHGRFSLKMLLRMAFKINDINYFDFLSFFFLMRLKQLMLDCLPVGFLVA